MILQIKKGMIYLQYFHISLLKLIYGDLMVFSVIKWHGWRKCLQQFIILDKILLTYYERIAKRLLLNRQTLAMNSVGWMSAGAGDCFPALFNFVGTWHQHFQTLQWLNQIFDNRIRKEWLQKNSQQTSPWKGFCILSSFRCLKGCIPSCKQSIKEGFYWCTRQEIVPRSISSLYPVR